MDQQAVEDRPLSTGPLLENDLRIAASSVPVFNDSLTKIVKSRNSDKIIEVRKKIPKNYPEEEKAGKQDTPARIILIGSTNKEDTNNRTWTSGQCITKKDQEVKEPRISKTLLTSSTNNSACTIAMGISSTTKQTADDIADVQHSASLLTMAIPTIECTPSNVPDSASLHSSSSEHISSIRDTAVNSISIGTFTENQGDVGDDEYHRRDSGSHGEAQHRKELDSSSRPTINTMDQTCSVDRRQQSSFGPITSKHVSNIVAVHGTCVVAENALEACNDELDNQDSTKTITSNSTDSTKDTNTTRTRAVEEHQLQIKREGKGSKDPTMNATPLTWATSTCTTAINDSSIMQQTDVKNAVDNEAVQHHTEIPEIMTKAITTSTPSNILYTGVPSPETTNTTQMENQHTLLVAADQMESSAYPASAAPLSECISPDVRRNTNLCSSSMERITSNNTTTATKAATTAATTAATSQMEFQRTLFEICDDANAMPISANPNAKNASDNVPSDAAMRRNIEDDDDILMQMQQVRNNHSSTPPPLSQLLPSTRNLEAVVQQPAPVENTTTPTTVTATTSIHSSLEYTSSAAAGHRIPLTIIANKAESCNDSHHSYDGLEFADDTTYGTSQIMDLEGGAGAAAYHQYNPNTDFSYYFKHHHHHLGSSKEDHHRSHDEEQQLKPLLGSNNGSHLRTLQKGVHFGNVEVREYNIIIGDNPWCSNGTPLTLDWDYTCLQPEGIDSFEGTRTKKTVRDLLLNYYERREILSRSGYSDEEIDEMRDEVDIERRRRYMTAYFEPLYRLEEFVKFTVSKYKCRKKSNTTKQIEAIERVIEEHSSIHSQSEYGGCDDNASVHSMLNVVTLNRDEIIKIIKDTILQRDWKHKQQLKGGQHEDSSEDGKYNIENGGSIGDEGEDEFMYTASGESKFERYSVKVDHSQHDKSTQIILCNFDRPHMRVFHLSWMSFFVAFFAWFAITPLLAEVQESLNLTSSQIWTSSLCGTASTIVTRILMGPACDKFGARACMTFILVASAIPTALTGVVTTSGGLCAVRTFIGIGGSAFVACQYWTSSMFTREIAGTALALVAGWGNLGGGFTQIVTGSIMFPSLKAIYRVTGHNEESSSTYAWKTVFIFPAMLSLIVAYMNFYRSDDSPKGDNHELVRQQKLMIVNPCMSLWRAAGRRNTWILFLQYACCFGVEVTFSNATALYFHDQFGQDTMRAAAIASTFGFMNIFARGLGGAISDICNFQFGVKGRVCWQFVVFLLEGIFIMLFGITQNSLVGAIFVLIFTSIFVQGAEGSTFGIVPYVDRRYTGSVVGWVGAGGNFGGVVFAAFFRDYSYRKAFLLMGFTTCLSAFLSLLIDRRTLVQMHRQIHSKDQRTSSLPNSSLQNSGHHDSSHQSLNNNKRQKQQQQHALRDAEQQKNQEYHSDFEEQQHQYDR